MEDSLKLTSLPTEIIDGIVSYCGWREVGRSLPLTCRRLHTITCGSESDSRFWKLLFSRLSHVPLQSASSWKNACKQILRLQKVWKLVAPKFNRTDTKPVALENLLAMEKQMSNFFHNEYPEFFPPSRVFKLPLEYKELTLLRGNVVGRGDEYGFSFNSPASVLSATKCWLFDGDIIDSTLMWIAIADYSDKHIFYLCCDASSKVFGRVFDGYDMGPWGMEPSEFEAGDGETQASLRAFLAKRYL